MSKKLTHKAKIELAKARLTGGNCTGAEAFVLANKLGVTSATINFHGGGDSGDFEPADLEGGEPRYIQTDNNWTQNPKWGDDHEKLQTLVKDIAEKWVERTGVDWYNDDGGGGELSIDFKTGEVSGSIYYYEQVRHDADSAEWNLLDDDSADNDEEGGDE